MISHRVICYIEIGIFASIPEDDVLQYFQRMKSRIIKQLPKLRTPVFASIPVLKLEMYAQ